ncbi:MAG TPA: hypothetical protein VIZ65_10645 [Cellvibrionaceae bacterium]
MTTYLVFIANRLWLIISLYITSLALASLFFSCSKVKASVTDYGCRLLRHLASATAI